METIRDQLQQLNKHLLKIINTLYRRRDTYPPGYLRITRRGENHYSYYQVVNKKKTYLPQKDEVSRRMLAQKTYEQRILRLVVRQQKLLEQFLKDFHDQEIEQIYLSESAPRQQLIQPIIPTFDQLLAAWNAASYEKNNFHEEDCMIQTECGELVRSKSEKIIADLFQRKGIAYKYEKPLTFPSGKTIYPDFTIFSKKHRQEVYWEHFGMMGTEPYSSNAISKINTYVNNGIFPGVRLFFSFEATKSALSTEMISAMVDHFLM